MPKLAPDSTVAFILAELDRVTLAHSTFTEDALALIVRSSEGVLRAARNVCVASLLEAVDRTRTVDLKQFNRVLLHATPLEASTRTRGIEHASDTARDVVNNLGHGSTVQSMQIPAATASPNSFAVRFVVAPSVRDGWAVRFFDRLLEPEVDIADKLNLRRVAGCKMRGE